MQPTTITTVATTPTIVPAMIAIALAPLSSAISVGGSGDPVTHTYICIHSYIRMYVFKLCTYIAHSTYIHTITYYLQ